MYHTSYGGCELIKIIGDGYDDMRFDIRLDDTGGVVCVYPDANKTLFFEGEITINDYCGDSAEGIKFFEGMKRYGFDQGKNIWVGEVYKSNPFDKGNAFTRSYATHEAAEAARDKHFTPKTYPLPEWLEYSAWKAVRVKGSEFVFREYEGDWIKHRNTCKPIPTAHLQECKLEDVKVGEFFTFVVGSSSVTLKLADSQAVVVNNSGEIRYYNLREHGAAKIYKINV